jgi:hypothetical protein
MEGDNAGIIVSIPLECVTFSSEEFDMKIEEFNADAQLDDRGLYVENLSNRESCAKQLITSYFRFHSAGEHHINKTEFFHYITSKLENCSNMWNTSPQENEIIDDGTDLIPTLVRALSVANFMTIGI